jgi:hypothetical protein
VTIPPSLGAIVLFASLALSRPASGGACSFSLVDLDGKAAVVPDTAAGSPRLVVFYRGHW